MSASTPATEAADRATLETPHRGLLMVALMGVTIMQFLDITIANVALPHMQASLGATLDTIPWVVTSYIIAGVMATPAVGWISAQFGSRRVFLMAVAGFLAASMACGAAASLEQMMLFRALQGLAAAFIAPMSQTLVFDINPPSRLPTAVTVWSAASMLAPISGPVLGGLLCEHWGWRWIFYINLPLGIPTLLLLWWLLPSRPRERRHLDRFGLFWLALGLGALQLFLDRGQHKDWFESGEIVAEAALALAALWIFAVHSLTTDRPLFSPRLFANGRYLMGLAFMFLLGLANVAILSVLPIMYDGVWNYDPLTSGLLLMPRGIGLLLTMTLTARLMTRVDVRYLTALGFGIVAFAMWLMSRWTLEMGREPIVVAGFIQGLGLGFTVMPINVAAFSTVEPDLRPDGSSLINLMRNIGASFGVAGLMTLISRTSQVAHAELAAGANLDGAPWATLAAQAAPTVDAARAALALAEAELSRQALMLAYLDVFHLLTFVLAALGVAVLFVGPIRLRHLEPGLGAA
ncbi:MAG: EmrB/QacA family drug resistance transporter [Porticoccaceae bacterium]|nr:MAG: EmrB/QacA family drug resistance transporter [Porticoccaceae bacterium]